MANKLIFIRHGEVDTRFKNRMLGSTDVHLSRAGRAEAETVSRFLLKLTPDLCVSSPMKRCLETASPCIERLGLDLEIDEDLREVDFGIFETRRFDELAREFPDVFSSMATFDPSLVFSGGEGLEAFGIRIQRAIEKWLKVPQKTVVFITHAGFIRFAVCRLLGIDLNHHTSFDIAYASVVAMRVSNGKGILEAVVPCSAMK